VFVYTTLKLDKNYEQFYYISEFPSKHIVAQL